MGDDKDHDVLDTGAPVPCAADASCLLHIGGQLSRQGAGVVLHPAEILASNDAAAVMGT